MLSTGCSSSSSFCEEPQHTVRPRVVNSSMEFAGEFEQSIELSASYSNNEQSDVNSFASSIQNFDLELIRSPSPTSSRSSIDSTNSQNQPLTAELASTELRNDAPSEFANLTSASSVAVARVELSSTADLRLPSGQTLTTSPMPVIEVQNGNADWPEYQLRQCSFLTASCDANQFPLATSANLQSSFLPVATSASIEIADQQQQQQVKPVPGFYQYPWHEQSVASAAVASHEIQTPVVPDSSQPPSCPKRAIVGCGQELDSHEYPRTHLESQSVDKPLAYTWPSCGSQKFRSDGQARNENMTIRSGEQTFACDVRDEAFASNGNLKANALETHSQKKTFPCHICSKTLSSNGSLKRHILFHSQNKNYQCTVCQKIIPNSGNLKSHMLAHARPKIFPCSLCDKTLKGKRNFQCHMLIHEKEKLASDDCGEK